MGRSDLVRCFGKRMMIARTPLNNCCQAITSYIDNEKLVNFDNNIATKAATAPWQKIRINVFLGRISNVSLITKIQADDIAKANIPTTGEKCSLNNMKFRKSTKIGLKAWPMSEVAGVLFSIMKKIMKAPIVVNAAASNIKRISSTVGILKLLVPRVMASAIKPLSRKSGPIASKPGRPFITLRVNMVPTLIENTARVAKNGTIIEELFHRSNEMRVGLCHL